MKTKILTTLLLALIITGCQKQPEEATTSQPKQVDSFAQTQFEISDEKITKYLDQLDDPNTTQEVRIQILCKDYPTEYKTNYMPVLLHLAAKDYNEAKLLSDLDIALDYYKKKDNIHC